MMKSALKSLAKFVVVTTGFAVISFVGAICAPTIYHIHGASFGVNFALSAITIAGLLATYMVSVDTWLKS